MLETLQRAGLGPRIPELVMGLSEPSKSGKVNALRALLEGFGVPFLDHHTGVGGRYSVLTNVGLLPAAVLGVDVGAIRAGAGGGNARAVQHSTIGRATAGADAIGGLEEFRRGPDEGAGGGVGNDAAAGILGQQGWDEGEEKEQEAQLHGDQEMAVLTKTTLLVLTL